MDNLKYILYRRYFDILHLGGMWIVGTVLGSLDI